MTVTRRRFTAIGAAGIAATFTPAVAQQPQKLTVRTDFPPWGMHAGLHLAVDNGSFKDAGLDVDVSDGKGSSLVMQQVTAGEIDIGWVQLGPMAAARGKGMPITSIAGKLASHTSNPVARTNVSMNRLLPSRATMQSGSIRSIPLVSKCTCGLVNAE